MTNHSQRGSRENALNEEVPSKLTLSTRMAFCAATLACAFWGVSFLAPRALPLVEAQGVALFRFLFFGLSSVFFIALRWKGIPKISRAILGRAVLLSMTGYSVYYFFLAAGVKGAGVSFSAAIIGLLPLSILLATTDRSKWKTLWLPILLITVGTLLIPVSLFDRSFVVFTAKSSLDRAFGIFACFISLGLWTYFAVANARFLKQHPEWNPIDWSSVMGISAGATAVLIFCVLERSAARESFALLIHSPSVLFWTGFMGIFGTWIATGLWNYASRVLPSSWLGQLLVFETLFGLIYGFIYEARLPSFWEALSLVLLGLGSIAGVRILLSDRSSVPPRNDKSSSAPGESA